MSNSVSQDTANIQKLLLRAASAVAAGAPLSLQTGETRENVNAQFVTALGIISRASRLDAVVQAVKPIADRLGRVPIEGDGEDADAFRTEVQQLAAAIAALNAFDVREADHTIIE
jgi:hypothetical protein